MLHTAMRAITLERINLGVLQVLMISRARLCLRSFLSSYLSLCCVASWRLLLLIDLLILVDGTKYAAKHMI
jgi:hypothetical protein